MYRQTDKETDEQADRQGDRRTGGQTRRQLKRRTDKETASDSKGCQSDRGKHCTYVPFLGLGSRTCFEEREEDDTEEDRLLLEEPGSNSGIKIKNQRKNLQEKF